MDVTVRRPRGERSRITARREWLVWQSFSIDGRLD